MIHGKKKQKNQKTEQQIQQQQQLSNKINSKLLDFFQIRNKPYENSQIPKYMQFTSLLMQLCSDIPTIFNFRRQLLQRAIKVNQTQEEKKTELLQNQIKLNTKLIKEDPKSYTLWSFRQWLVQCIYENNKNVVKQEKYLCKKLLQKDEKNFHVWNYRNWVNSIQFQIDQELSFTEQKIKTNPFNFSPYHFRSKYLPLKYEPLLQNSQTSSNIKQEIRQYGMPKQIFDQQLQTIKTAIYLNSNQQAPWIYYRWLLKRILPVIVLSSKTTDKNVHTFVLNERVLHFNKLFNFSSDHKILNQESLTNIWQFQTAEDISNLVQNLKSPKELVETQGMRKRLVLQQNEDIDRIREIFRVQQSYVKQIISQQGNCRFAWLQLLQIYKNKLQLRCNLQQWNAIVSEGQKIFEQLDKQLKTKQYIERLKQHWLRIGNMENLKNEQILLIK